MGQSINNVTRFWGKIDSPPSLSQSVINLGPASKITSQAHDTTAAATTTTTTTQKVVIIAYLIEK